MVAQRVRQHQALVHLDIKSLANLIVEINVSNKIGLSQNRVNFDRRIYLRIEIEIGLEILFNKSGADIIQLGWQVQPFPSFLGLQGAQETIVVILHSILLGIRKRHIFRKPLSAHQNDQIQLGTVNGLEPTKEERLAFEKHWQTMESLPLDIEEVQLVLIGGIVVQKVFVLTLLSHRSSHYKNVFY
jgi:hypothetical protein